MDYWLDHPEEKDEMSRRYIEYSQEFRIENSVTKLETMFHDAIDYYHNVYASA